MIGKKPKRPYMVVYNDEKIAYGADAAILLSELRFLSHRRKKDDRGYFSVENTYICKLLGIDKRKLIRDRDKLIKARRIDYIQGKNQNVKSRYKIVL